MSYYVWGIRFKTIGKDWISIKLQPCHMAVAVAWHDWFNHKWLPKPAPPECVLMEKKALTWGICQTLLASGRSATCEACCLNLHLSEQHQQQPTLGNEKKTTCPMLSSPLLPARPLICLKLRASRKGLSPAITTARHGMWMPYASVPVAITTCNRDSQP